MVFHVLLVQSLHGVAGTLLAPGGDHDGHVVQQVEAVKGGGDVLGAAGSGQPCAGSAAAEAGDLLELVVVPLQVEQAFQLMYHIPELGGDVLHQRVGHVVIGVEGDIQHDHGNVQLLRQILIPLDHAVADVIAAQHHIGHGHVLLGAGFQLGVGHGDTGVGADVIGVAIGLRHVAHTLTGAACGDTGGLILRIYGGDAQGLRDLHGEVAGYPCHGDAVLLGLDGVHKGVSGDLAQLILGGIGIHRTRGLFHFFCHVCSSLFSVLIYNMCLTHSLTYLLACFQAYRAAPMAPKYWASGS